MGLSTNSRMERECNLLFPYHFDVDGAAASRENPYETKANTKPMRTDNLYEHTEKEATGLAFNGYPKLLLFLISLRQLPFSSVIKIIKNTFKDIISHTKKSRNISNTHV